MEEAGSSFDDFSIEMEDFEFRQVNKFDRIFRAGMGGSFSQQPLVHDGMVYVGCMDHHVYAIDASDGTLIWKLRLDDGILVSSAVESDGIIYIGGYDQDLKAIDAKTGELLWKFHTRGKIMACACVHGNKLYFGSNDQNLYCIDKSTAELRWKFATQGEVVSTPCVREGKVFFGSYDHNAYCLDAETGRQVWKFSTQGDLMNISPFLVHDGRVYFPSFDNYMRVVDASTGELIWKFLTGNYGGNQTSPVLYKGILYQANREGALWALSMEGKVLWKFTINHAIGDAILHEDRIYFGSEDFHLHCLDLSGKEIWKFETQGKLWWGPTISGEKVYFSSYDCNIYCVDVNTRRLVWKFRGQGAPSYLPPPFETHELVTRKEADEEAADPVGKRYEFIIGEDFEGRDAYKSRVTYRVSNQYAARGKYQKDSDEEAL